MWLPRAEMSTDRFADDFEPVKVDPKQKFGRTTANEVAPGAGG